MPKQSKQRSFVLTGDIRHAGKVRVFALNTREAIKKAEAGDFELLEEESRNLGFDFDGDADHVELVTEG